MCGSCYLQETNAKHFAKLVAEEIIELLDRRYELKKPK